MVDELLIVVGVDGGVGTHVVLLVAIRHSLLVDLRSMMNKESISSTYTSSNLKPKELLALAFFSASSSPSCLRVDHLSCKARAFAESSSSTASSGSAPYLIPYGGVKGQ